MFLCVLLLIILRGGRVVCETHRCFLPLFLGSSGNAGNSLCRRRVGPRDALPLPMPMPSNGALQLLSHLQFVKSQLQKVNISKLSHTHTYVRFKCNMVPPVSSALPRELFVLMLMLMRFQFMVHCAQRWIGSMCCCLLLRTLR